MPPTLLQKGKIVSDDPNLKEVVPINYIMEWFKNRTSLTGIVNRVLVINATTGAGKTTVIPPNLYEILPASKSIVVTQPRIITAIKNAREIATTGFYPKMKMGENIGYQTGPEKFRHREHKGVLFATVGVLTMHFKILSDDELIKKYSAILIDEIHEMSVELADLLFKIKMFLLRNKDKQELPFVVCMSATIDKDKYIEYFGLTTKGNFISIEGLSFHRELHWEDSNISIPYVDEIEIIIRKISDYNVDDETNKSDILIFLPNKAAMITIEKKIDNLNKLFLSVGALDKISLPLKLDRDEIINDGPSYNKAFIDTNKLFIILGDKGKEKKITPKRKIIMSTNVAETGLTIDTLKYVIDWGYHRGKEFYPTIGAYVLINKPAAQSRILQRIGRIGRKFPGEFYAAYSKKMFDALPKQQLSDLILSDNSLIVLDALRPDVSFDAANLDFIENLPSDSIHYAIEKCYVLGFCDEEGKLTQLGKLAQMFSQQRLEIIRLIFAGYFWDCNIFDLITIAAGLEATPDDFKDDYKKPIDWTYIYKKSMKDFILNNPSDNMNVILKTKILISDNFIDFVFLFAAVGNIVKANNIHKKLVAFCKKANIKLQTLMYFLKKRDDIIDQMLNIELNLFTNAAHLYEIKGEKDFLNMIVRFKYCIYDSFRLNMATLNAYTLRYEIASGKIMTPLFISDNSISKDIEAKYGISRKCMPKHILYNKLELKYNKHTKMYDQKIDYMSAMDGFVKMDINFI